MQKSEQINELATALAKAQGAFEIADMDSENPHFKSKYASLGSIILAVKKGLTTNGLAISQMLVENEKGMALETTLFHSSGQWLSGAVPVMLDKQNMQGLGSAITYAKRYAIAAILGVVADQDDDGEAAIGRSQNGQLPAAHTITNVTTAANAFKPKSSHACAECGTNMLPSKFKVGEYYCPNKKNHEGSAA